MKYTFLILSVLSATTMFAQTNSLHPQSEEDNLVYELASVIDSINLNRVEQLKKIDSLNNEYRITLLELNQKKMENEMLREKYLHFHQEEMLSVKQDHLEWQNKNLKNKFYTASGIAVIAVIAAFLF